MRIRLLIFAWRLGLREMYLVHTSIPAAITLLSLSRTRTRTRTRTKKAAKKKLTYLSLPRPLSCIASCLNYHLASVILKDPVRYPEPALLLYSILSVQPMPRRTVVRGERCDLLPVRIGVRDHASASPGLRFSYP